jgi:hypothetical protein
MLGVLKVSYKKENGYDSVQNFRKLLETLYGRKMKFFVRGSNPDLPNI